MLSGLVGQVRYMCTFKNGGSGEVCTFRKGGSGELCFHEWLVC